jgi:EAL domain-containing protein (putative c-di-GMP-specific phosphodiesterase class I)
MLAPATNSFDLLRRIQVDGIKVDRSFTRTLVDDPVDRAQISIGKVMHLEIVAEGVEDEATYQALLEMKADAFQEHRFHEAELAVDIMQQQFSRWFKRHEMTSRFEVHT